MRTPFSTLRIALFVILFCPLALEAQTTVYCCPQAVPAEVKVTGDPTGAVVSDQGFIDAHTACPTTGCKIKIPCGTWRLTPSAFNISKDSVTLEGENVGCTTIVRHTDVNGAVISATGHNFTIRDMKMEDFSSTATNTGVMLQVVDINEFTAENLWLQYGYNLLKLSHGSNHAVRGVTVESARNRGVWILQTSDVLLNGLKGYSTGFPGGPAGAATIYVEKDAAYAYPPQQITIANSILPFTNRAHSVHIKDVKGLVFSNNQIGLSGRYEANTFDDVKLEGVTGATVNGNTGMDVLNTYSAGNRATRWNFTVDATSTGVVMTSNKLVSGITGGISNAAADTIIIASDPTSDQAVPILGMGMQSFMVEFVHSVSPGGVIQHRIIADGSSTTLGVFANRISGASATLATSPAVASGVGFVSGGGIDSTATQRFVFNTADQTAGHQKWAPCAIEHSTAAGFVQCDWKQTSLNVNGVTRRYLTVTLKDGSGAAKLINTTNITSGQAVRVRFDGYLH